MKKPIYLGIFTALAALIVSSLWATGAATPPQAGQDVTSAPTSQGEQLLQDLTSQSDLILSGRCLDTNSMWIEDGRVLVTVATISVEEVIKGDQAQTVSVVLPGGVDLNRRIPVGMTYPGAPQIMAQEEVFLFLSSEAALPNSYAVAGFAEGKFSIVENESGEKLVSRDPVKTKVKDAPGRVRGNRQYTPLNEFKERIRSFLRRQ
jgi:hypothetical protein